MNKGMVFGMTRILPASFLWVVLWHLVTLCLAVLYFSESISVSALEVFLINTSALSLSKHSCNS